MNQQALAPLATRPPDATLKIVDMACGTGVITRLITEELALEVARHASSP
jgi:ubiquinone/menaquinone biosynthesis C-methylase UbiE